MIILDSMTSPYLLKASLRLVSSVEKEIPPINSFEDDIHRIA
uniref:Uncharacterized protein MANES_14G085900 n=1 Tax=Rhizophora mucronata TaxID=61149 RepID=A0A2P2KTJ2_RHIMU